MKKHRFGALLLTGALFISLMTGCSGKAAPEVSTNTPNDSVVSDGKKEELVFVNYRDIRDLNPHLYAGEMYAQEMLYESLVNITEAGYEGCLAESWEISEDGKVYTFKIREGVTFSDGTACDANAIFSKLQCHS